MTKRLLSVCFLAWIWVAFAHAQTVSDSAATKHVEVRLIAEGPVPAAGGTFTVALKQKIIPGWHTYWRNAGDSGEPTKIEWKLPQGFSAADIQWPPPKRIPIGPLANFGFENEVWLLTTLTAPAGLTPGSMTTLEADVTWLVCQEICIPQEAQLRLEIDVEAAPKPNAQWADAFARARAILPESPALPARFALQDNRLALAIDLPEQLRSAKAHFFPDTPGFIKNAADQIRSTSKDALVLHVPGGSKVRIAEEAAKIESISGVLVFDDVGGQPRAVTVTAVKGEVPAAPEAATPAAATAPSAPPAAPQQPLSLWTAIGFALLGGLILNLMPCVFPVLSMKAMALVRNGEVSRSEAAADGLAYLLGVLVTFCALAAAVIFLRNAGEAVGWGFQLQSPFIVAILAYVLFAVGLNLSGVFQMGGGLMGLGARFDTGSGRSLTGSFMTGTLAVVVAAPCTVPFMGAAVGYALTQSSALTFVVFIALGFGLALPWLVISMIPGLTAFIPRGGAWTNGIKEFLAFPMYASAAWLIWVLSQQTDSTGLFRVLMGIVAIAFAAWIFGRSQSAPGRAILSSVLAIFALGASLALIAAPSLPSPRAAASAPSEAYKGPAYEPYTAERLQALLAEGKPVFVNMTAAWCITCLFNEQVALDTVAAKQAFIDSGTIYLKGDWTNRDPAITALLRAHGRDGVPLYLFYPAGSKEPQILPQVLTPAIVSAAVRLEPKPQ
jgi:thiol:disulfide interchange protein